MATRAAPSLDERTSRPDSSRRAVRSGFVAAMPLWPGVIPFAAAMAIAARTTGFSALETQLLSLTVFAGAAQITIISLAATGASTVGIAFTAILLNLRHLLYGMVLRRMMGEDERPRPELAGSLLTDEGFGLTIQNARAGGGIAAFMLGSGLSLYLIWNVATLAGILFGSALPDPERIGLAFIFPLTFIALMRPLLLNRTALVVAGSGAAAMLVLSEVVSISSGVALPVAACIAALAGTLIETRDGR